ncbi:Bacterial regulatory proteins, tetR family [bacterium YEK0313]|nr:Bacterial regulatory proteins, tetR family [bacterium YEK0313]
MSSTVPPASAPKPPRRRLLREERHRQLLAVAWRLVGAEGADALTLPRLAEAAGITKPVVYDHFGTRFGLLVALYEDFDARQTGVMDAALAASEPTLIDRAAVIASSYVDCVLAQGREIPGVIAALAGAPDLEKIKRDYRMAFVEKCRSLLAPFAEPHAITAASLWAMLGAADALSHAAASGDITAREAKDELFATIVAMVDRHAQGTVSLAPDGQTGLS